MKKVVFLICFGMLLFVFCGCNEEQEKSAEITIPQDISGSWQIRETKIDVSEKQLQLNILADGTWALKEKSFTSDYGTYSRKADDYVFISSRNSAKFMIKASSIGKDILDLKIKSDEVPLLGVTALRTGDVSVQDTQAIPSKTEMQNMSTLDQCEQTQKMMKSISTALEAYATDMGFYPSGSVEGMKAFLEPFYIKELPVTDGWGNPWKYEVFFDKNQTFWQRFRLISMGSDRVLSYNSNEETSSGDDIVIVEGHFVKRCSEEKR